MASGIVKSCTPARGCWVWNFWGNKSLWQTQIQSTSSAGHKYIADQLPCRLVLRACSFHARLISLTSMLVLIPTFIDKLFFFISIILAGPICNRIEEGGWWKISSKAISRGSSDLYNGDGLSNFPLYGYLCHCRKAFSQESHLFL